MNKQAMELRRRVREELVKTYPALHDLDLQLDLQTVGAYAFKVGDRVKINPTSEYKDQSGGGQGRVHEVVRDDVSYCYIYIVEWEHGGANSYRGCDLLPAEDYKTWIQYEKLIVED